MWLMYSASLMLLKNKYETFFSGSLAGRDVLTIDQENVMEKRNRN